MLSCDETGPMEWWKEGSTSIDYQSSSPKQPGPQAASISRGMHHRRCRQLRSLQRGPSKRSLQGFLPQPRKARCVANGIRHSRAWTAWKGAVVTGRRPDIAPHASRKSSTSTTHQAPAEMTGLSPISRPSRKRSTTSQTKPRQSRTSVTISFSQKACLQTDQTNQRPVH